MGLMKIPKVEMLTSSTFGERRLTEIEITLICVAAISFCSATLLSSDYQSLSGD